MSTFQTVEEAREFFGKDRFASDAGIELCELMENGCLVSMPVDDRHKNAYGGVMGGAIFTLADFALAVTANQIHNLSVAQEVSIHFLSAPKGTRLFAKGNCIKNGKTTMVIEVEVFDETEKKIALFLGTAFKL